MTGLQEYIRCIVSMDIVSIGYLYVPRMADAATQRLLHEIDSNGEIQQYLKEVCDDLNDIIHSMCLYTCLKTGASQNQTQTPNKSASRTYKYNQTLHFLMKLGTTQNSTHPGSVRNCDIQGVFARGNIRERCALLMNMLSHDKKYCIMQWVLQHVNEPAVVGSDDDNDVARQTEIMDDIQDLTGLDPVDTPNDILPLCVNTVQVMAYKQALGLCDVRSRGEGDVIPKKDIRKALCKLVNCPRKNTRVVRPLFLQHIYALPSNIAVPCLSLRETLLIHETQNRSSLLLFRANGLASQPAHLPLSSEERNCMPHHSQPPMHANKRLDPAKKHREVYAKTTGSGSGGAWCTGRRPESVSTGAVGSVAFVHRKIHKQPSASVHTISTQPQATLQKTHEFACILPWLTGRMCWDMVHESSFFIHACRRKENMVAGPSGHTHALLTFMRIFKNFDVRKWALICVVWLVGADHHSVYEVLVVAARHGLKFTPETNSVDFMRALLHTLVAARRKPTAWGSDVAVKCRSCVADSGSV